AGAISSVELTALYLNRIHAYDLNGIKLNSIPVLNPAVLDEAKKADEQRAAGTVLGPLHGVPYTVKDSYKVAGLTVASGSPAFANLTAKEDAFTVSRIRQSGGVLIGKTNMPPLAAGGMQRGVYGRAESPYNAEYLTAAWFSGSSNGSATSTAANFAAFGMGEETVSSGRSPASNNALVAYTPSRGVISIRGNWPLFPVRDVVVPHTRTVEDLMRVLDVIVAEDVVTKGDFWRHQTAVKLPKVVDVRPKSYLELKDAAALKGKRIGVPRMYIGKDFGGTNPIRVRPSIVALWEKAAADLRAQGAEVIEVDFPVQNNYDGDRVGAQTMYERGLVPYAWQEQEFVYVTAYSFEEFLQGVGDANFPSMTQVNPALLFPNPPGSVDERRGVELFPSASLIDTVKAGVRPVADLPHFAEALQGLENTRKVDLEDWMKSNKLDLVVFPANANIGKANADVNDASYDEAWENGNYFSNMNYTLRDLGIPSVSVSMGVMKDTGMPVNLTFIGPAYSDSKLIRYAYAYESATHNRAVATRVAPLADEMVDYADGKSIPPGKRSDKLPPVQTLNASIANGVLALAGTSRDASKLGYTHVYVNGSKVTPTGTLNDWTGQVNVAKYRSGAYAAKSLFILVLSKDAYGNASATTASVALPPL
ncbi:MAG: amidase, partial [Rubrivivax sp.]